MANEKRILAPIAHELFGFWLAPIWKPKINWLAAVLGKGYFAKIRFAYNMKQSPVKGPFVLSIKIVVSGEKNLELDNSIAISPGWVACYYWILAQHCQFVLIFVRISTVRIKDCSLAQNKTKRIRAQVSSTPFDPGSNAVIIISRCLWIHSCNLSSERFRTNWIFLILDAHWHWGEWGWFSMCTQNAETRVTQATLYGKFEMVAKILFSSQFNQWHTNILVVSRTRSGILVPCRLWS